MLDPVADALHLVPGPARRGIVGKPASGGYRGIHVPAGGQDMQVDELVTPPAAAGRRDVTSHGVGVVADVRGHRPARWT